MSIRITTLGAIQVVRGDSVLAALPSQRLRCALLVYLAVNRRVARDRLLAMFWPDRTEERARHALSQNVYELRRALGEDWIEVRGEQFIIASHITIDVVAFEESVERGDFGMALSLYRGPFLDGNYLTDAQAYDSWVDSVRQRMQRHHRRARREWITQLLDQERVKDALIAARDWTGLDPADDEAQHRLIELLAMTGDRAGAIGQYEHYERLLAADELQPLDETRALVERIRNGDVGALPSASAVVPPPVRSAPPASPSPSPLAPVATPTAAAEPETAEVEASEVPWLRRHGRSLLFGIGSAALVLMLWLGLAVARDDEPVTAAPAPHRVAVLYFDDRSPPPGASYLADGLTETLIDAFSGLDPMLTVRSREIVGTVRGKDLSWDSLSTVLDVDLVISGRVVRADGQVRVNLELVDPVSGTLLESRQVQRAEGQYLELLDDLVSAAALVLRQRIGAQVEEQRHRLRAPSSEAWMALRVGMDAYEVALKVADSEDVTRAREAFARADSLLAAAERFGASWAEPTLQRGWLAEKRALLETSAPAPERTRAWLDTAVTYASRVLAQKAGMPEALELRGAARQKKASFATNDDAERLELFKLAESDLRAATQADPGRAKAHAIMAVVMWNRGHYAEANDAARRAHQLDAYYGQQLENLYYLAMTDFELGRDEEAAKRCDEGLRRFGDHRFAYCALTVMAWSDRTRALPDSAWAIVDRVARPRTDARPTLRPMLEMLVAASLLRAGAPDSAKAVLDRAAAMPSSSAAVTWIEGAIRGRLGDMEGAARLIHRAVDERPQLMRTVGRGRALQPLVSNPAVLSALERVRR